MRTTIAALLTLTALCFALAACGGSDVACFEAGDETVCHVASQLNALDDKTKMPHVPITGDSCTGCHAPPTGIAATMKLEQVLDRYRAELPRRHPTLVFERWDGSEVGRLEVIR